MDPAKSIIATVGGYDVAARITGKHKSRVYRWTYPTSRGGTGGIVPHEDALKLLDYARANDLPLSPDHFMQPASEASDDGAAAEATSGGCSK